MRIIRVGRHFAPKFHVCPASAEDSGHRWHRAADHAEVEFHERPDLERVDVVGYVVAGHDGVEVLDSEEGGGGYAEADEEGQEDAGKSVVSLGHFR